MKVKRFGSMSIAYQENDLGQSIIIASYDTPIAYAIKYKEPYSRKNYARFDSRFYSHTTRKHQGIAYSVLDSFNKYGFGFITTCLMQSKSQEQLKKYFGYTPKEKQYNTSEIDTAWVNK